MLESIKFSYEVSDDQSEAREWSPYHVKYDCVIKHNGKQFSFPYFCNRDVEVELKTVLRCLLIDAFSVENTDLIPFMQEMGYDPYEDLDKAKKVYNACLRINKAILYRLFTDEELDELQDELGEYYY